MSLTVNAKTYTADLFNGTSVGYQGPLQSSTVKDRLTLKKTDPKASAVFSGVNRFEMRALRTVPLTGAKTPYGDVQVRVEVISPVGIADADRDSIITDFMTYGVTAGFKTQVKTGQVNG